MQADLRWYKYYILPRFGIGILISIDGITHERIRECGPHAWEGNPGMPIGAVPDVLWLVEGAPPVAMPGPGAYPHQSGSYS